MQDAGDPGAPQLCYLMLFSCACENETVTFKNLGFQKKLTYRGRKVWYRDSGHAARVRVPGERVFLRLEKAAPQGNRLPGVCFKQTRSVSQTTPGTRDHRSLAADVLTAGGSGRTSLSGRSRVLVSGPLTLGKLISIRTRLRGTDVL